MSADLQNKVNWAKYLRMVGALQSDIALVAFGNGDFWRPEVKDELVSLHEACQKAEACIWRLFKLMHTKDFSDDKEAE